jgi:hypothetical protein
MSWLGCELFPLGIGAVCLSGPSGAVACQPAALPPDKEAGGQQGRGVVTVHQLQRPRGRELVTAARDWPVHHNV